MWPGLAAIHTLFVREHNRIADQLSILTNISTAGQDELIYQEARKIVAAELQVPHWWTISLLHSLYIMLQL